MRDEDVDETSMAARHNELRDIHHRIDSLKEEAERQYGSLIERLHALEVAIAKGNRFPAAAWVGAASLFVAVLGSGIVTYSKLEQASVTGHKAISLIEQHMAGSSARFETIQDAAQFMAEWNRRLPSMDERLKALEGRIVGQGPEGWHRKDHDLYAQFMDERFQRIQARVEMAEGRQEQICSRIAQCKGTR